MNPRPSHHSKARLLFGLLVQQSFTLASRLLGSRPFDPASIEITRPHLTLPGLHPAFEGLSIAHLSDLHLGTWLTEGRLRTIVSLVNDLDPDLVLITGDFVSYTAERPLKELARPLSLLTPNLLTLAVLGNHDHWTDPEPVRAALRACGIVELPNRIHTLHRDGGTLHIAGLDDAFAGQACLETVLTALPPEGAAILLIHEPDYADFIAPTGRFALQLSGHAHGGQVVFPVVGPPMLPRYGRKYPSGFYQIDGLQVYTSRGIGTTSLRLRVNCPPEIPLITLHALSS